MALPEFEYSGVSYDTPTAGTDTFNLVTSPSGRAIPYLERGHINVFSTVDDGVNLTALLRPSQWDFNAGGTQVVLTTPADGATSYVIRRDTPITAAFVTFQAGRLTSAQLNDVALFNLYTLQEFLDKEFAAQIIDLTALQSQQAINTAGIAALAPVVNQSGPLAGFRNKIINGDTRITQRRTGTSITSGGYLVWDRWTHSIAGGSGRAVTYWRQTLTGADRDLIGSDRCLSWEETTAGSGYTEKALYQAIEGVTLFAGKQCTISFWSRANTPITVTFQVDRDYGLGGSAYDTSVASTTFNITTSWVKHSYTFTMPSLSGKTVVSGPGKYDAVWLSFKLPTGSTFRWDITNVQFEEGPVATEFERRPLGVELALCQRYYNKSFAWDTPPAQNISAQAITNSQVVAPGGSQSFGFIYFPVTMYDQSAVTIYNPNAFNALVRNVNDAVDWQTSVVEGASPKGFHIYGQVNASGGPVGSRVAIHYSAEAEL